MSSATMVMAEPFLSVQSSNDVSSNMIPFISSAAMKTAPPYPLGEEQRVKEQLLTERMLSEESFEDTTAPSPYWRERRVKLQSEREAEQGGEMVMTLTERVRVTSESGWTDEPLIMSEPAETTKTEPAMMLEVSSLKATEVKETLIT